MKIQQRKNNEIDIFEVSGEIDFHTSPALRDQLLKVMEKNTKKILVNLKKVNYIDSSGLATFVEALQKLKRTNGRIVLVEMESAVRSVFEIAKLDSVFLLVGSEQEAVNLLTGV